MIFPRQVRISVDASLRPWEAQIKYVLRTLLRVAGLPYEFRWYDGGGGSSSTDIYYGPPRDNLAVPVTIVNCGRDFAAASQVLPTGVRELHGQVFLNFGEEPWGVQFEGEGRRLVYSSDIVFASYWLLIGAREPNYPRDHWDNIELAGSCLMEEGLLSRPLVSFYSSQLRSFFTKLGYVPLELPWAGSQSRAAFVFTHDVDYPEIIRSIECLRLLATRGSKGWQPARGVLKGTNHFWKFAEWVEFEKSLGTRPAFYFMAQQGSLLRYAAGNPDAFYDIRKPRFRELFRSLRDAGCEIGLHASYNAYRSSKQLASERALLEKVSGAPVEGNRHHFWHLDPAAPEETLHRQEQAGFGYDSSLEFEFYPGFRRGICHPFRPFHPGLCRELNLLELPPAWMDDHFDRRLAKNHIRDAAGHALGLMSAAQATGGIVVVDYHARGMNADFYPRYGPWLMEFLRQHLDFSVSFRTPAQLAREYCEYEARLRAHSVDSAEASPSPLELALPEPKRPPQREAAPSVSVGFLRPEEATAWDALVEAHPDGNIYHTLAWKAVTEEGLGHRAYYLRAVEGDGRIAGILPLFLVRGIFGRRLVSMPMRDRGGVLTWNKEIASRLVERAIRLARELQCEYLELRSFVPMDSEVLREHRMVVEHNWVTTRLDLSPGEEQLWKALDRDAVRWAIKNAERKGVRVEMNNSEAAMDIFYELFVATRTAMGIPPFPKSLFQAIWCHLIRQNKANLFLVRKDAQPIHAMINLISKDTFVPAYAAPQNAWRKWYPNECMFWHTIRWAAQQGFHYYDFGADSPKQVGLLQFKRKWGGQQYPIHYHFYLNGPKSAPSFDSSAQSYEWMRKAWALLPTAASKTLGAWVTRQLS